MPPRRQGLADNPVLVGAGTMLVILVMVLLSYNANQGLPFVPTYDITADVPSGANVVTGNDVRIGGARVGLVTAITPKRDGDKYYAQLSLKLDKNIGPIPVDSRIQVRPRSTIGLKYIQLTLGDSNKDLANGGGLPIEQSSYATEFEDLFDTFSKRVRQGNKRSLREFGDAFAGRGQDLNVAFGELPSLFENLEPVAETLAARGTRLNDFIRVMAQVATSSAAAGTANGEVWANAHRTFAAWATATKGIEDSIAESPETLQVMTEEFPKTRPYIGKLTRMMKAFQPGAKYLPQVSEDMAVITVRGPSAFNHLYRTTPKFTSTFRALGEFSSDPQVRMGVKGLATFVETLNQPLSYITPAQTVCNYMGLFARNIASSLSGGDGSIGWLRFGLVAGVTNPFPGANSEAGAASGPASFTAKAGFADSSNYLHANPQPYTASPGQPDICAAGNETSRGEAAPRNRDLDKAVRIGNPAEIKRGARTEDTAPVDQGALKR